MAGGQRILVVEDEDSIADVVCTAFRYHGFEVEHAAAGAQGLNAALDRTFDLIVLDVMLPAIDGFEICQRLRDRGCLTPVLFLTARADPDDRIQGFLTGGDDYLPKPFSVDELVLRVRAILRRSGSTEAGTEQLRVGDVTLDPDAHEVRRRGELVELSPTEFRLLHYLMTNVGSVLSKPQILVNVWDDDYDGSENVVELYVGYLRRKIDDEPDRLIHTRRGVGYVMTDRRQ